MLEFVLATMFVTTVMTPIILILYSLEVMT